MSESKSGQNKNEDNTKQAVGKAAEGYIRYKLSGGGLRGFLESLPAIIAMLKKINKGSKYDGSNSELNKQIDKWNKEARRQAIKFLKEKESDMKELNLKIKSFPKMPAVDEDNIKKIRVDIAKWLLQWVRAKRKLDKHQTKMKKKDLANRE